MKFFSLLRKRKGQHDVSLRERYRNDHQDQCVQTPKEPSSSSNLNGRHGRNPLPVQSGTLRVASNKETPAPRHTRFHSQAAQMLSSNASAKEVHTGSSDIIDFKRKKHSQPVRHTARREASNLTVPSRRNVHLSRNRPGSSIWISGQLRHRDISNHPANRPLPLPPRPVTSMSRDPANRSPLPLAKSMARSLAEKPPLPPRPAKSTTCEPAGKPPLPPRPVKFMPRDLANEAAAASSGSSPNTVGRQEQQTATERERLYNLDCNTSSPTLIGSSGGLSFNSVSTAATSVVDVPPWVLHEHQLTRLAFRTETRVAVPRFKMDANFEFEISDSKYTGTMSRDLTIITQKGTQVTFPSPLSLPKLCRFIAAHFPQKEQDVENVSLQLGLTELSKVSPVVIQAFCWAMKHHQGEERVSPQVRAQCDKRLYPVYRRFTDRKSHPILQISRLASSICNLADASEIRCLAFLELDVEANGAHNLEKSIYQLQQTISAANGKTNLRPRAEHMGALWSLVATTVHELAQYIARHNGCKAKQALSVVNGLSLLLAFCGMIQIDIIFEETQPGLKVEEYALCCALLWATPFGISNLAATSNLWCLLTRSVDLKKLGVIDSTHKEECLYPLVAVVELLFTCKDAAPVFFPSIFWILQSLGLENVARSFWVDMGRDEHTWSLWTRFEDAEGYAEMVKIREAEIVSM